MGFVVGINIAICLRLLGIAPALELHGLSRFYPIHWYCALLILFSGFALLLAYPAKALTNPVFYLKLAAIAIALGISRVIQVRIRGHVFTNSDNRQLKLLAGVALGLWVVTITAGRFLAYTNSVLLASRFY